MAKWIWKFGEFELYHNMLVHGRRQSYGYVEAPVWKLYAPEPVVDFRKKIATAGGRIRIVACGEPSTSIMNDNWERIREFRGAREITLEPGEYYLDIRVINPESFPALFIDGVVESDASWEADDFTLGFSKVGTWDMFDSADVGPDRFPFSYEEIKPCSKESRNGGCLYSFDREYFGSVSLSGMEDARVKIQYGESVEEALDPEWSVIHFETESMDGSLDFPPYAFRYIYVSDKNANIKVQSEYLPLKRRGDFKCDDKMLDKIWDVAADTFHLNCREFFLDGIKRDRWVWSADTYQSLFVNRYLFSDGDIERRTLVALGGKAPFKRHINTITDYTFFWIMSLYEHYRNYGDIDFIEQMKPQLDEVIRFCLSCEDSDGFIRSKRGDWLFIDWAELDKEGAFCPEQILYAKALEDYALICKELGDERNDMLQRAERIRGLVWERFWDGDRGTFIDSYESGRKFVSRQTNILAYLFLPCGKESLDSIYRNAIISEDTNPITTPYFMFYENQVHCMAGYDGDLEQKILDYYGGMINAGATTLYEQYDPHESGVGRYAMYGRPYEKSLCHAWSASPIYMLGYYRLGVRNTGIAYGTYEVRPSLGRLNYIEGTVPTPHGDIHVHIDKERVTVLSEVDGGELVLNGRHYPIMKNEKLEIDCK